MKRTTQTNLILLVLLALALSACVRPAPDSGENPLAPTTAAEPVTLPGTVSTPTPQALVLPTLDPALDPAAGPTATPMDSVIEPTAEAPVPVEVLPADATPPGQTTGTGETIHVVQAGENLFRIGLRYGFTAQELATYNGIPNVNLIYVGQEIRIPPR